MLRSIRNCIVNLFADLGDHLYLRLTWWMGRTGMISFVIGQGINTLVVVKVQSALGTPAAGSGGQVMRRRTSIADKNRATYVNDEIVGHQQSTGVNLGSASTKWDFDGLLSPGTYSGTNAALLAYLMRKDFTATAALTSQSITIAVVGGVPPVYTLTRTGGTDYLAGGIKIGDVVRITAGTYVNGVNRDNNILVTALTATVLSGVTLNGTVLIAEGPIATSTITVMGKKTIAPLTGQTDKLITVEEWMPDITKSLLFPDLRVGQADISLPASGNAGIKLSAMGLGVRTIAGAQVLTTPTAATTSNVLTAVRGLLIVNGVGVTNVTGVTLSIKGNLTPEGPVVGSNYPPDMSRGRIEVSGQFTALMADTTLMALFDAETLTSLVCVMAADTTNLADFVGFSMSAIKLTDDSGDDGEKAKTRSYPFTAQINAAGGAALASDQTILSIQDSLAS